MNNKRFSLSSMLHIGALMALLLMPCIFIGQPLYKWKSGKATIGKDGMYASDTIEHKGNQFHVWYWFDFIPKQPGESNMSFLYNFIEYSPSRWDDFNLDEYGREYAVIKGVFVDCLNGRFDNVEDNRFTQAAFPMDSIPLNDGKGKYKKTFRLSRSLPNTGRPVYVTSEVEIDLKKMKGNKVKTTFSTKEGNAEYDILYRYYYRGPKKENIINFPPPLE